MNIYKLPPISNWEIFEDLCCDLWNNLLHDYKVKRFGRRGQKQKGIDITCKSHDKIIGIQCKCVNELKTKDIDDELNKLDELNISLNEYIIATTVSRDVNLDEYVLEISEKENFPFDLSVIFWEDIEDMLFKEPNLSIIKDYYPDYFYDDTQISQILKYGIEQFKKGEFNSVESCLNTIKTSLKEISRKNKYELCILEGNYLSLCRELKKAGEKYIQAYDVSSKDIKSKYYYALGLFYNKNIDESKNICNAILKEDPLNQYAYSILILIDKDTIIPTELIDSPEINYNLGINAHLDKDYKKAYNFFKKSNLNNPINLLNCANTRLLLFGDSEEYPFNIDLKDYNKNLKIERIFQDIFDKFTDKILSNYFDIFPNLLALNKSHKHFDALERNVNRLLSINSDDENILFYKSVLLERKGDVDEALDILKEIPKVLDSFIFIIKILVDKKDTNQVIKNAEYMYNDIDKNSKNYLFCQGVLINSYIEIDQIEDAEKIIETIDDVFRYNFFKSKLYNDIVTFLINGSSFIYD